MMFAKPNRQSEPAPRRQAVKINVATETRDAVTNQIVAGVDEQDTRGRQTLIGPSELGNPCDFCLGARLAGLSQPKEFEWTAWGGTQYHKGLSKMFKPFASQWFVDHRVVVGEVDGNEITGELDLFDVERNTVVDFKVPLPRKLEHVRFTGDIPIEYETQLDLYGVGLKRQGWKVTHVANYFLPRCDWIRKPRELWSRGFWYARKLNEGRAERAIERADRIAKHIRLAGPEIVVPTLGKLEGCFDCKHKPYNERELTSCVID